jgi:hypothetical protein
LPARPPGLSPPWSQSPKVSSKNDDVVVVFCYGRFMWGAGSF